MNRISTFDELQHLKELKAEQERAMGRIGIIKNVAPKPKRPPKKTRQKQVDEVLDEFQLVAIGKKTLSAAAVAAGRTFLQAQGRLTEKQETTHRFELTIDEHIAIRKEAGKRISELRGTTDGDRSLLPESPLLPTEIREDTPSD